MPAAQESIPHPTIAWAQRKDRILLTICLEDVKNPEITIKENQLLFKGVGGTEQKLHACSLDVFGELDPEKSSHSVKPRNIELILMKKESGPFWPRLLKEKGRLPWLKTDFNRWKDEDEDDEEDSGMGGNNFDFENMMSRMGGMGGMGDAPNMDDLNLPDDDDDEDDEDLPELEESASDKKDTSSEAK